MTWAQGEPLCVSLMQAVAETRDYTRVSLNNMQHFTHLVKVMWDQYVWGMTDHEIELPEKELHKKTK